MGSCKERPHRIYKPAVVTLTLQILARQGHVGQRQLRRITGAILGHRHRHQVRARLQQALVDRHRLARR